MSEGEGPKINLEDLDADSRERITRDAEAGFAADATLEKDRSAAEKRFDDMMRDLGGLWYPHNKRARIAASLSRVIAALAAKDGTAPDKKAMHAVTLLETSGWLDRYGQTYMVEAIIAEDLALFEARIEVKRQKFIRKLRRRYKRDVWWEKMAEKKKQHLQPVLAPVGAD